MYRNVQKCIAYLESCLKLAYRFKSPWDTHVHLWMDAKIRLLIAEIANGQSEW